jgi:hypothetical protein
MWASQLLTFNAIVANRRDIVSEFILVPNYVGVERIELVMFNCPISALTITILSAPSLSEFPSSLVTSNVLITSCDSLVRVCISVFTPLPVIYLRFIPPPGSTWVHLAEVKFYDSGSTCPPDTITTTAEIDSMMMTIATHRPGGIFQKGIIICLIPHCDPMQGRGRKL